MIVKVSTIELNTNIMSLMRLSHNSAVLDAKLQATPET